MKPIILTPVVALLLRSAFGSTRTYRAKSQRGMAFAATISILFICLCVILIGLIVPGSHTQGGILDSTSNASLLAKDNMNQAAAFNLAESGVEYTLQWLHEQSSPPASSAAINPAVAGNPTMGTWGATTVAGRALMTITVDQSVGSTGTFSVMVYPDTQNQSTLQKKYLIESVGAYGGATQIVASYVAQSSFGEYAYFTDLDDSGGYWTAGIDSFDGPMHSNNSNGTTAGTVPTNIIWYNAAGSAPMFTYTGSDAFTCCASTINWNENAIGNHTAPASTSDWSNVAAGGVGSVHTGVASIPLPTSSILQKNAALGTSTAPTSAAPTVLIPSSGTSTSGGIYIHGNISQLTFSTTSGTTQNVEVDQTDATTSPSTSVKTYITMNPATNLTSEYTVKQQGTSNPVTSSTTSVSGVTNGMIYADGDIGTKSSDGYTNSNAAWSAGNYYHGSDMTGGVSGTIADNYYDSSGNLKHVSSLTLATPTTDATGANENMNIDGSIVTNTQRLKDANGNYISEINDPNYIKSAGTFGIVGNTIEVVNKTASGSSLTNCEVDGSVLALDTFDCTDIYGRPVGNFQVMGGYIARQGGYFGVIDYSGNLLSGFHEHYNYDARMANNPPPYFPTTNTNFNVVSWQRTNVTMQ